jgi:hypothetical protein
MTSKVPFHLIAVSAMFFMFVGCSTMKVPPLTTGTADSYTQHQEQSGLIVGVQPMTDKKQIENTFKVNLLDKGLLPILLVAENRSASDSFMIPKGKITIVSDQSGTVSTSQTKEVASGTAGTATGIAGAVLLGAGSLAGAPLAIAGMKMASNATVIQYNLRDKEFYSQTLEPGGKVQGFIYFQFSNQSPPSGDYHLVAEVKSADTGNTNSFDFPINLTLNK